MKLTRSEFQNYIHSYEQDEIFYRDLYFAEKEHPETFREYCQNLDREMIAQRKLYVPALRKEGWLPYLNEGTLFQDFTGDIMLSKHYRYTPAFAHEHEFFEIMCIYDGTVKTTIQGIPHTLQQGDVCIIPPHTRHSVSIFDDSIAINILVRTSAFQSTFFQTLTADSALSQFFTHVLYHKTEGNFLIFHTGNDKIVMKSVEKLFIEYLGHEKYLPDVVSDKDAVGSVNGLAWTSVGGVVMPLEVLVLDGKGRIELTGSLGDVMKESAKIAVSYCRSVADKYGIDKDFYEKKDLHIHAPEGAVPKDGPSAGVTMITGIISALGNIKVRSDVAMTGEITLSGKVLPIGGLREKTMAAYKAGVKTIIVPFANKGDLDDVDDTVKLCCEFVFAKTIQDVLDVALVPNSKNNVPLELLSKNEPERKKLTV